MSFKVPCYQSHSPLLLKIIIIIKKEFSITGEHHNVHAPVRVGAALTRILKPNPSPFPYHQFSFSALIAAHVDEQDYHIPHLSKPLSEVAMVTIIISGLKYFEIIFYSNSSVILN